MRMAKKKKVMLETENVKVVYEHPGYGFLGGLRIYRLREGKWRSWGRVGYAESTKLLYHTISGSLNAMGANRAETYEGLIARINYWNQDSTDPYYVPMTKEMFEEWMASMLMEVVANG